MHYTIKALGRAGFKVTDEKMIPSVKLPSGNSGWILYY